MINWGVIGLGNMGNMFARSIQYAENSKLISIASKSSNKLQKFGNTFNIGEKNKFSDYNELISSKKIDAIYISTLNNSHLDLINTCARNNKNILCEKPITINFEQACKAQKIIKESDILFHEAIAYRSHPQTLEMLRLLKSGAIGNIKKIESTFGFKVRKVKKSSRLFNKEMGGGAILDLGCYPISFFFLFCNKDNKLEYNSSKGSFAVTDVDDEAEINFSIGSKIKAIAKVSLKQNYENSCKIYGDQGIMNIPSPWLPNNKSYIEIFKGKSYYKKFIMSAKDVYANQIENVSNSFNNIKNEKNNLLINIDDSVKIMKVIDNWSNKICNV